MEFGASREPRGAFSYTGYVERHFQAFVLLGGAPSLTGFAPSLWAHACTTSAWKDVYSFCSEPKYVESRERVKRFCLSLFCGVVFIFVFLLGFDSILLPQNRG